MGIRKRLQVGFIQGAKPTNIIKDPKADGIIGTNNWDFNIDGDISILDFEVFKASVPLWLEFQARQRHAAMVGFNPAVDSDGKGKVNDGGVTRDAKPGDRLVSFADPPATFPYTGLKGNYAINKDLHYIRDLTFKNNIHTSINGWNFADNVSDSDIQTFIQKAIGKNLISLEKDPWKILTNDNDPQNGHVIYPINSNDPINNAPTNWYTYNKTLNNKRKPWRGLSPIGNGNTFKTQEEIDAIKYILQNCYIYELDQYNNVVGVQVLDYDFFQSIEGNEGAAFYPLIRDDFFRLTTNVNTINPYSYLLNYIKSYSAKKHNYKKNVNTKQENYTFWELLQEEPENLTATEMNNLDHVFDGTWISRFNPAAVNKDDDRLLKIQFYYSFLEKIKLVSEIDDPSEFDVIKKVASPDKNSSYMVTEKNTNEFDIATNSDGKAVHFHMNDIEYFEANTEQSLIPQNRDLFISLCKFIVENAPNNNPFSDPPNQPVVIPEGINPKTIDYGSKGAADLLHAMLTDNVGYIHFTYGINALQPALPNYIPNVKFTFFKKGNMSLRGQTRDYSLKKVIEPPVYKLEKCHDGDVYYVKSSPFYDYSLTGLYNLANIGDGTKAAEKDIDFFPIDEDKHTYYLYAMSDNEVRNDYLTRKQNCGGENQPDCPGYISKSWDDISGTMISNYLYPLLETGIPEGCYTFYRVEYDPSRPYFHLPNRWEDLDPQNCLTQKCLPPPPSPPPPPTPPPTPSPSPTPSNTKTPRPSSSPTPTITPSNTPSPSISHSKTPSRTPTPSNTPSPSISHTRTPTRSPTPSRTPTSSISHSITPTRTPTPSRTPSPSISDSQTPTPTSSPPPPTPTHPSPTPTISITPTPTRTSSPTPSITPSNTRTETPTRTPSPTPSITPSNTRTETPTRTPTPTPSSSSTPPISKTPTKTPSPTPSNSRTQSPTPTSSKTPSPSRTQTPTSSISPSITPTSSPTPSISKTPSVHLTGCQVSFYDQVNSEGLSMLPTDYPGAGC